MTNHCVDILLPLCRRMRTDVSVTRHRKTKQILRSGERMTIADLEKHCGNGLIRGQYLIEEGASVTRVGVLDLDSHKGEVPWPEMCKLAVRLADVAAQAGLKAALWRSSGGQGIHLWFVWDEPQDAYSVREALRKAVESCGLKIGVVGGVGAGLIESFPKQDSIPAGAFGNQVWLPFGTEWSAPLVPGFIGDELIAVKRTDKRVKDYQWQASAPVPILVRPKRAPPVRTATACAEAPRLADMLTAITNYAYDNWLKIGMALHDAAHGESWGLDLWIDWSSRDPDYEGPEACEDKWQSFGKRAGGEDVTVRSLEHWARGAGWTEDLSADFAGLAAEIVVAGGTGAGADTKTSVYNKFIGGPAILEVDETVAGGQDLLPALRRTQDGHILATIENIEMWLKSPFACGNLIKFDNFRDEIMFAPANDDMAWQSFRDTDYTKLRLQMERSGFKPVAADKIKDVVKYVAEASHFDSATLWLESLKWDGTKRVETFLGNFFGCEDNEYNRSVSCYLWTALAGRVLVPGVKADMVPVLIGLQGIGKSFGIEEMVPSPDHYESINLLERDADMSRRMRGKLVMEIGELKGLHSRDMETIKEFVTRRYESWVPKYNEFARKYPRRGIFIGTTNQEEFLADSTGNRRWLPVRGGQVNVNGIREFRLQLWAEARGMFKDQGVMWKGAQKLAEEVHEGHRLGDIWLDEINNWFYSADKYGEPLKPCEREYITVGEVLAGAMGLSVSHVKRGDEMRTASALRELGFIRKRVHEGEKRIWAWVKSINK